MHKYLRNVRPLSSNIPVKCFFSQHLPDPDSTKANTSPLQLNHDTLLGWLSDFIIERQIPRQYREQSILHFYFVIVFTPIYVHVIISIR